MPVIVDAGVGTASDAAIAMELGCTAVLMNTGIAGAKKPVLMAEAMRLARRRRPQGVPRRPHAAARLRERVVADRRPDRVADRRARARRRDHRSPADGARRASPRAIDATLAPAARRGSVARSRSARRISTAARCSSSSRARGRGAARRVIVNDRVDVALAAGAHRRPPARARHRRSPTRARSASDRHRSACRATRPSVRRAGADLDPARPDLGRRRARGHAARPRRARARRMAPRSSSRSAASTRPSAPAMPPPRAPTRSPSSAPHGAAARSSRS